MEINELKISDHEFKRIRSIVYQTAGINLTESKRALIVSRFARRLRQLQMESFKPYIRLLESDADEMLLMINRITTNLTRFYREDTQFSVLKERILPQIMQYKKKHNNCKLRIWSAGCSTGEEVYTILFEVLDAFHGRIPTPVDLKILGSDIDTNVLKKAGSGVYSREELLGVSSGTIENFFDRFGSEEFRIKDRWRQYVGFKKINLVYDPFTFKNLIDIIFCRNVVIYFDKSTQKGLYEKFFSALNEPGFFFSGHSENLFKYSHAFKFVEKSIYKKVV